MPARGRHVLRAVPFRPASVPKAYHALRAIPGRCAVMDFSDGHGYDRSLVKGAEASMKDVLAVKKDERGLIISNPNREVRMISMALYDAALKAGAKPVLMYQVEKGHFDFAEEEVVKAMASEPDIVLSISSNRLGKDKWGLKHGYKGKKRKYDHIFDQLSE